MNAEIEQIKQAITQLQNSIGTINRIERVETAVLQNKDSIEVLAKYIMNLQNRVAMLEAKLAGG